MIRLVHPKDDGGPTRPRRPTRKAPTMDTTALVRSLSTQLAHVGIGHEVSAAHGDILVRGVYGDPITVTSAAGTFHLVGDDGRAVDTRIRTGDPAELLGLYLVFHTLWSMDRLVRTVGAADAVGGHPRMPLHGALLLAHLGMLAASREERVATYARRVLGDVRGMLSAR